MAIRLPPWASSAHFRLLLLIVIIELCLVSAMLLIVSQQLHNGIDARDESVANQRLADLVDDTRETDLPRFRRELMQRPRTPGSRGDIMALADR
ncbi:MAG: hypothetical protein ABW048_11090, partial [Sphingobium sp.]